MLVTIALELAEVSFNKLNGDTTEKYTNFVIKFGALADFTIKGGLYARAGLLGAFTLPHKGHGPKDSRFGVEIPVGIGIRF